MTSMAVSMSWKSIMDCTVSSKGILDGKSFAIDTVLIRCKDFSVLGRPGSDASKMKLYSPDDLKDCKLSDALYFLNDRGEISLMVFDKAPEVVVTYGFLAGISTGARYSSLSVYTDSGLKTFKAEPGVTDMLTIGSFMEIRTVDGVVNRCSGISPRMITYVSEISINGSVVVVGDWYTGALVVAPDVNVYLLDSKKNTMSQANASILNLINEDYEAEAKFYASPIESGGFIANVLIIGEWEAHSVEPYDICCYGGNICFNTMNHEPVPASEIVSVEGSTGNYTAKSTVSADTVYYIVNSNGGDAQQATAADLASLPVGSEIRFYNTSGAVDSACEYVLMIRSDGSVT